MDTNNVGEFIQLSRKAKGFTQKELAEKINVSDKTISKWENGNSLPDTAMLSSLCRVLDISVNELLSGEKLPPKDYSKKAEENIMNLLQENQEHKKARGKQYIWGAIVFVLSVLCIMLMTGGVQLGCYIDILALLMPMLLCLGVVLLSGKREKYQVIHVLRKTVIPAGIVPSMIGFVCIMAKLDDVSTLGANLAVCVLTILYTSIAYLVLYAVEQHKEP